MADHSGDCLGKSESHYFTQEKSMPEVIASTSGNYSALIGTMVRPCYFIADGDAFVNTLFGLDLSKAFQDGSFQAALIAHKVELAIVYPRHQDNSTFKSDRASLRCIAVAIKVKTDLMAEMTKYQ